MCEDEKCLMCRQNLDNERKPCKFGEKGLRTLKLQGANWKKIEYYFCTNVYEKINILVMHLVKHKEFVRKYLTFDARTSKTNKAKKKYSNSKGQILILILIGASEAVLQYCTENMQ